MRFPIPGKVSFLEVRLVFKPLEVDAPTAAVNLIHHEIYWAISADVRAAEVLVLLAMRPPVIPDKTKGMPSIPSLHHCSRISHLRPLLILISDS